MKAAVFRSHNRDPTRVVKIEDTDIPKINPHEVLIKVESASYNYNDLWAIWGEPIKVPMPHISGTDIAGTIIEVGENVTSLKKGDRVVSHANLSCRICKMCTSGREYDCEKRLGMGISNRTIMGRILPVYPFTRSKCSEVR